MNTSGQQPWQHGPSPGLCVAIVERVVNADPIAGYPADVNVAQAFTYDVRIQGPLWATYGGLSARVVSDERWPYPYLVRAFRVGGEVHGRVIGSFFGITTTERPFSAPCSFTPGGA